MALIFGFMGAVVGFTLGYGIALFCEANPLRHERDQLRADNQRLRAQLVLDDQVQWRLNDLSHKMATWDGD